MKTAAVLATVLLAASLPASARAAEAWIQSDGIAVTTGSAGRDRKPVQDVYAYSGNREMLDLVFVTGYPQKEIKRESPKGGS